MRTKQVMISVAMMFLTLLFTAGCEHDVDEPSQGGGQEVTFDTILRDVFEPHCATCHMGGAASGGFAISGYNSVVNAPSTQKVGLDQVEPGNPGNSYLYLKITDDPSIEGNMMPPGNMLSQDTIDLVETWINADAPASTSSKSIISAKMPVLSRR